MVRQRRVTRLKPIVSLVTIVGCLLTAVIVPAKKVAAQTPFLSTPYYGRETQTQGFNPPAHHGIDWALYYESVLAAADGNVYRARWQNLNDRSDGYGLYVSINHTGAYSSYQTRYGHLSAIVVSEGEQGIPRGQIVGTSGNTGHVDPPAPDGQHLHFELRQNGVAVDPGPLWLDGEQAGRPFPVPRYSGSAIIVDDQSPSPQFTKGCAAGSPCPYWYPANLGYQNHMYWTYVWGDVEDYWARWRPTIPETGFYELYVWIPNQYATSWFAPYTVYHADGQRTVRVDQRGLQDSYANQWVSLGVYRFAAGTSGSVRVVDATGEAYSTYRRVGVDAIRLRRRAPVYLPHVHAGYYSGWASRLFIRNDGPGPQPVRVHFYDADGTPLSTSTSTPPVQANATWQFPAPGFFAGCAVVEAAEPVTVMVRNETSGQQQNVAYTGVGPAGTGSAGWDAAATTVYAPLVMKRAWEWSTTVYLHNVGTAAIGNLWVRVYAEDGQSYQMHIVPDVLPAGTLVPHSRLAFAMANWGAGGPPNGFFGSMLIESDQPLAVVAQQSHASAGQSAYNAFTAGAQTLYLPEVMNQHWYWTSSFVVQNTSTNYASVTVTYSNGTVVGPITLPPRSPRQFYQPDHVPAGFYGWATVTANRPVVAITNQQYYLPGESQAHQSHSALLGGTTAAYSPFVRVSYDCWTTNVSVQNLAGIPATIGRRYFWDDGSIRTALLTDSIDPGTRKGYYAPDEGLGYGFHGSGAFVCTNSQVIGAVSNMGCNQGGDFGASFNLPPR